MVTKEEVETKTIKKDVIYCDLCGKKREKGISQCRICGRDICHECEHVEKDYWEIWRTYCNVCWNIGKEYHKQLDKEDKRHSDTENGILMSWKDKISGTVALVICPLSGNCEESTCYHKQPHSEIGICKRFKKSVCGECKSHTPCQPYKPRC